MEEYIIQNSTATQEIGQTTSNKARMTMVTPPKLIPSYTGISKIVQKNEPTKFDL